MGTAVLAGFLPGIGHYTYWQPPGYFFFLSLVLRCVPVAHHFLAMRLFSWFLGAAALLLGASILRRFTPSIGWGWLGLVVLATQVSFIQVANVGRMEMIALVCNLAALNRYLAYRVEHRGLFLASAGFMAGLAMLCHPVGILTVAVMVVHEVAAPQRDGSRGKHVVIFSSSMLAPFLPWIIYITQAPRLFSAQMAAQSVRKSLSLGTLLTSEGFRHWFVHPFQDSIWPLRHSLGGPWPFTNMLAVSIQMLILGVGLAALLAEGRRPIEASMLGSWALGGYAINLFLPEFWYSVHFTVPCCLLLGWVASGASRRNLRALALATLAIAAILNFDTTKSLWAISRDGSQRYKLYCSTLARNIPPHSRVLLAAIPDPYFGLVREHRSYQFYEFVPEDVPVDISEADRALGEIDYVVGSACCRPDYLVNYLLRHGRVEVDLGERGFDSPPVVIWKLRRPELPSKIPREDTRAIR